MYQHEPLRQSLPPEPDFDSEYEPQLPRRRPSEVVIENSFSRLGILRHCLVAILSLWIGYVLALESGCGRVFAPARICFLWYWLCSLPLGFFAALMVYAHGGLSKCLILASFIRGFLNLAAWFWGIYLCLAGNRNSCGYLSRTCDVVECFMILIGPFIGAFMESPNFSKRLACPFWPNDGPAAVAQRHAPACPRHPPWNLTGMWRLGKSETSLCLRHWGWFGAIFSTHEPEGGETFFGRVLPKGPQDENGWYIVGAFGSRQAVLGDVTADGCIINWGSSARWVRETEESPIPRSKSADLSVQKCCGSMCRNVSILVGAAAVLVALIVISLFGFARLVVGSSVVVMCTLVAAYCVHHGFVKLLLPMKGLRACLNLCVLLMDLIACALLLALCALLIRSLWPPWTYIYYGYAVASCGVLSLLVGLVKGFLNRWANFEDPATWHECVSRSNSPEDQNSGIIVFEEFASQCDTWQTMYPFTLEVVEVLHIKNPKLSEKYEQAKKNLATQDPDGNMRRLYHGTSGSAAKAIVTDGFKLQMAGGMFGKGIYFADTPLKSWQYSSANGWDFLLVCDVLLGAQKEMTAADHNFSVAKLERSLSNSASSIMFDSLVGLSKEQGGTLRVPEYIVFKPDQILPRYLVRVREKRQGSSNP